MSKIAPIKFITKTGEEIIVNSPEKDDFETFNLYTKNIATQSIFTNDYPEQPNKDRTETLKKWKIGEQTKENCFLLAFHKKHIIGSIEMTCDTEHPWAKKTATFRLSIDKTFWRKGIGEELLHILITQFKKAQLKRLDAVCDYENFPGLNLYMRNGFKIEGLLKSIMFINNEYRHRYKIALINEKI